MWSESEVAEFSQALRRHHKDFHLVSRDVNAAGVGVRPRTTQECVAFYYDEFKLRFPWFKTQLPALGIVEGAEGTDAQHAQVEPGVGVPEASDGDDDEWSINQ
jgi:hypothetical protein